MNKEKICLLCSILMVVFFLTGCSGESTTESTANCQENYHMQVEILLEDAQNSESYVFSDGEPLSTTTVCNECHSEGGTFDGVNDPNYGAKSVLLDEDGSPYDAEGLLKARCSLWCAGCHDDTPASISSPCLPQTVTAPNIAGQKEWGLGFYETGHGLSPDEYYMDSNRAGAGLQCTHCHDSSLPHLGIEKYTAERKNYQQGYRLKSIDGESPLEIPRVRLEYSNTDFRLCYSCHIEAEIIGKLLKYNDYSGSEPYALYVSEVKTKFRNVRAEGGNEHDADQGDFTDRPLREYYPINSHWSHLALANKDVEMEPQSAAGGRDVTRQVNCSQGSGCHEPFLWDSDRDHVNVTDSRISCPACHNPHGTSYPAMTHNDLAITHANSDGSPVEGSNWEYGYIGSPEYGKRNIDDDHDLYCNECHGRDLNDEIPKIGYGEEFKYYPSLSQ